MKIFLHIFIALIVIPLLHVGLAHAQPPACQAWVAGESSTGEIYENVNGETPLPTASTIKLLTTLVVLDKIKEGKIKNSDVVTISARASKTGGSQVYLKENEQFSVSDLLEALIVQSANDSAIALAEHISGTVDRFVVQMNKTASEVGMKDFTITSPHGLPPEAGTAPDLISAKDFFFLSKALIERHPDVLELTSLREKPFREGKFIMRNHNDVISSLPGMDGLKTGFYGKAGFSLIGTASRDGVRIITAVMGCPDRKIRRDQTKALILEGFDRFERVDVVSLSAPLLSAKINNGVQENVNLSVIHNKFIVVPQDKQLHPKIEIEGCDTLEAPIQALLQCGKLIAEFKSGVKKSFSLAPSEEIARAPWYVIFFNWLLDLLGF